MNKDFPYNPCRGSYALLKGVIRVAGEINVGGLVRHRANPIGGVLVVIRKKDTGHGYIEYDCRWYNSRSGSYELGKFYNSELVGVKG